MDKDLKSKISSWDARAKAHSANQASNPFSGSWSGESRGPNSSPGDADYGRPKEGSRTALRGAQAQAHVSSEIVVLTHVLRQIGRRNNADCVEATFGQLFTAYESISSKLVGTLLRARRQGVVQFEGEMLYQGRDNHVLIRLTPPDIRPAQ